MKFSRVLALGAATVLALGVSGGVPAQATPADGAINVKVELGMMGQSDNQHRVFERTNSIPGRGPEVGAYDETQNPRKWCGDLSVDVDPATRRVTVGNSLEVCDFSLVRVTIESDYIRNLTPVSDNLFGTNTPQFQRSVTPTAKGVVVTWRQPSEDSYDTGGAAVFSWAPVSFAPAKVKVTGKKTAGKTLRVKGIGATSLKPQAASVSYQWFRGAKKIKGAKSATYKVKKADRGKKLRVRVTARAYGITDKTYASKKVKIKK